MLAQSKRGREAWSLIELLVVVAIIAVLLGMLFAAVQRVREAANRVECGNNMKQLGVAIHSFHDAHQKMPPYASGMNQGEIFGGWLISLLPYLDQQTIYNDLQSHYQPRPDAQIKVYVAGSAMLPDLNLPTLQCPSDPTGQDNRGARTNYLANWYAFANGAKGYYFPRAKRFSDLTDGLSNVVLFGEGYSVCDLLPRWALYPPYYHNFGVTQDGLPSDHFQYSPDEYTMFQVQPSLCDKWRAQTPHSAMTVMVGDGSVRSVARGIDAQLWKEVLKPNDGAPVSSDW